MKTVDVFQCELNKKIPLEYIGEAIYIGESFGVDSLTNNVKYLIVKDKNQTLKVVDDSEEDYIYDLKNPKPMDGSSEGGQFYYLDDPNGILKNYMEEYKSYLDL